MHIPSFRYQKEDGQIKLCVDTGMPNLTRLNGFVFQVEPTGCRVFFLKDDLVVAQRLLLISDVSLLKSVFSQKVMRIEDHSGDEPVALVAINRRLVSKTLLSTTRPATPKVKKTYKGAAL